MVRLLPLDDRDLIHEEYEQSRGAVLTFPLHRD